jgi:hypothetical protein
MSRLAKDVEAREGNILSWDGVQVKDSTMACSAETLPLSVIDVSK